MAKSMEAYQRRSQLRVARVENDKTNSVLRKEKKEQKREEAKGKAAEALSEARAAAFALVALGGSRADLGFVSKEVQTDITGVASSHSLEAASRESIFSRLQWSRECLIQDDAQVKFYTGLQSFCHLDAVYRLVSSNRPYSLREVSVDQFAEFVGVLSKLRLSLAEQDIAYRLRIHQSTFSRHMKAWIDAMFIGLQPLVKWPSRESLVETMPRLFRDHFRNCVAIIDCFEVFCERSSDMKAKVQSFSNYKHHNTSKFLIAASPQGVISFISKGWGGRVSDKYLTENCGILQHLLPGDLVLADRGFTVAEAVGLQGATLKLPPFTRGKKQLSRKEVDEARQMSNVRIHVERIIGQLRQRYTILASTVPVNLMRCQDGSGFTMLDKIAVICCALCNCCDSVIPFC